MILISNIRTVNEDKNSKKGFNRKNPKIKVKYGGNKINYKNLNYFNYLLKFYCLLMISLK